MQRSRLRAVELEPMPRKYPPKLAELLRSIFPRAGTTILDPTNVEILYKDFFDNPNDLWNKYIPFGCNDNHQTVFIYNNNTGKIANIWQESVPEDWDDGIWVDLCEAKHWL
jgi:hypothetical protein